MRRNVPQARLTPEQRQYVYYLWQYRSVDDLVYAVDGATVFGDHGWPAHLCLPGVRWRIKGQEESIDGMSESHMQTIEVRIMQGTLDADHINNWVTVLEHIVGAVRTLSNEAFAALLDQFLQDQTRDRLLRLLGVPDDIREYWLDRKRRDAQDTWWEYPDRDVVDWDQPFMIPGYRATHDPYYDD
ncbi:hypothetical protein F5Y10DRAFT_229356 [Nemania abortiva]|nr:hypothetical protein F5Y10DRAFT_229356 [Nemania abortiva]